MAESVVTMKHWQYLRDSTWVSCSAANSRMLTARREEPSLEPLYLTNAEGELWGSPEKRNMKFRVHNSNIEVDSRVRPAPSPHEQRLYLVGLDLENLVFLPSEACRELFEERAEEPRPKWSRTTVTVGTELYVAEWGELWTKHHGELVRLVWEQSTVSSEQYETMTQTRYQWEFNGPFREERMRNAVLITAEALESNERRTLHRMFARFQTLHRMSRFDPALDMTEHGSYQFNDFLCAHALEELACLLMDNYHSIRLNGWRAFDRATNSTIEKFRQSNHSNCVVDIRGEQYMLLFDGGGAGQPILIRPERYSCILNSIEDDVRRSAVEELVDMLEVHGLDIEDVIRTGVSEITGTVFSELASIATPSERVRFIDAVRRITHPEDDIATRIQQYLPVLLEKYKEGEVRLSNQEQLCPKKLCRQIGATLGSGLDIPHSHRLFCNNLKEMVRFIHQHQSWVWTDSSTKSSCHICLEDNCHTLSHCGSAKACLKCWVDTLVRTKMKCPFCRQEVKGGQLKSDQCRLEPTETNPVPEHHVHVHKKQRRKRFNSVDAILDTIKQDERYKSTTLQTTAAARQWFTILVRCKIIDMSQLNKCDESTHTLESIVQTFQVL